jgi:eukaryotic-like serine/threonine-protein kinase
VSRFAPGERLDRYEVIELLGAGAYAETYKALDVATGKVVVLKCPDPSMFADPSMYSRYRREAEVAKRLDHPGVQRGLDPGEHRTEPYLVLEYIQGESLRARMRSGPLDIVKVVDWGRQLAETLSYLHGQGIVHRDLKPENILVRPDDHLVVADFGTAQLAGARRLTWKHLSESLGTPDYMSPEQVQGARGDARSDVYAWGVMMFEMLTGQVPFEGDNSLAVMAGHMQRNPTSLRRLRPEVPPALEAVVVHAMRRYPENRYPSAAAVLEDLDHLDALDPGRYDTGPEPPMGGIAAADSAKRIWAWAAMLAAAFLGLCALIITMSVVLR